MRFLIFIAVFISLNGCNESDIPGYSFKKQRHIFKLIALGETNTRINTGSYVTFHIQYATTDSVFLTQYERHKLINHNTPEPLKNVFYWSTKATAPRSL